MIIEMQGLNWTTEALTFNTSNIMSLSLNLPYPQSHEVGIYLRDHTHGYSEQYATHDEAVARYKFLQNAMKEDEYMLTKTLTEANAYFTYENTKRELGL